jgi:hypothetical protein
MSFCCKIPPTPPHCIQCSCLLKLHLPRISLFSITMMVWHVLAKDFIKCTSSGIGFMFFLLLDWYYQFLEGRHRSKNCHVHPIVQNTSLLKLIQITLFEFLLSCLPTIIYTFPPSPLSILCSLEGNHYSQLTLKE